MVIRVRIEGEKIHRVGCIQKSPQKLKNPLLILHLKRQRGRHAQIVIKVGEIVQDLYTPYFTASFPS